MHIYPLTSTQHSIWATHKLHPKSALYNVGGYAVIKGNLSFLILKQSIDFLIRTNNALHLSLTYYYNEPAQHIVLDRIESLKLIDFSSCQSPDDFCVEWIKKDFETELSLDGPLFQTVLVKSTNCYFWYVKLHHIIADGLTLSLLFNKTADIYNLLHTDGVLPEYNLNNFSFTTFLEENKQYKASKAFEEDKAFWLDYYKNIPERIETRKSGSAIEPAEVERTEIMIPIQVSEQIDSFISRHNISRYHFFLGILYIFFSKVFQRKEFIIGLPVFNRSNAYAKQTLGTFINVIPFSFADLSSFTFSESLLYIKKELTRCYKHHRYTAFDLRKSLNSHGSLYNLSFSYQKTPYQNRFGNFPVQIHYLHPKDQLEDLVIHLIEHHEEWDVKLAIDYRKDTFSKDIVDNWAQLMLELTESLMKDTSTPIKDLSIISFKERQLLVQQFNNSNIAYPFHKTVHSLFKEQAVKTPDNTALADKNRSFTYKELDRLTDNFASFLNKQGVLPGTIVGVIADCSFEFVISCISILKAGGAYLPIDAQIPGNRIAYIIENSQLQHLLIQEKFYAPFRDEQDTNFSKKTVIPVSIPFFLMLDEGEVVPVIEDPDDLAYIIYTSGTTGFPKGVMIKHQSLLNYIWFSAITYVKDEPLNFPLFTSISFDLTVTSLFTPLITGNAIIVYQEESPDLALTKIIEEKKVGIIKATPSHLKLIRNQNFKEVEIKRFIIGGEELEKQLAKELSENFGTPIELYNEYGPTETTVGCIVHKFNAQEDQDEYVPIGTPVSNTKIYILDKNLQLLPRGAVGEIYIAGDGVAAGYLNNTHLTQEKFLENPFVKNEKPMYKTGDLGRWTFDGALEFLGRIDEQVKIRGFRIELREVENYLAQYPTIQSVKVLCRNDKGEKFLCAYFVSHQEISTEDLRTFLALNLPHYMIPSSFVQLSKMPLTPNGKIDKDQLPAPEIRSKIQYKAPRNSIEETVASVLKEVLKVDIFGITDNYFDLGGDSIKAIQVVSRLKNLGIHIQVKELLTYQTIEQLSLNSKFKNVVTQYDQGVASGHKELTPIEKWFFAHQFEKPDHYHQSVLLEFKSSANQDYLEKALTQLVEHHDGLRMNYRPESQKLFFNTNHLNKPFQIDVFDLSHLPPSAKSNKLEEIGNKMKQSFNINEGLLIKSALISWDKGVTKLLIILHHLVTDGVSWRILLEDLYNAYKALESKKESVTLPAKTASLAAWHEKLTMHFSLETLSKELPYWNSVEEIDFALPVDFITEDWSRRNKAQVKNFINFENTKVLLKETPKKYKTDISVILLAALAASIYEWSNQEILIVELENHGRHLDDIDVARTMGWFTSLHPAKITSGHWSIHEQIIAVKECLKEIPHNGIGYGAAKYLHTNLIQNRQIRTEIRFNYLGEFKQEANNDLFFVSDEFTGEDIAPENYFSTKIEINSIILNGNLTIDITYNKKMYKADTMRLLSERLTQNLMLAKQWLLQEETVHFTPSDFDTVDLGKDDLEAMFY